MSRRRRPPYDGPVQLSVTGLDDEGLGIACVGGRETRVLGALPGEEVTARHLRRRRRIDLFAVTAVPAPAADRSEAPCAAFGRCGGCVLQHLEPDAQLAFKEERFRARFRAHGLTPQRWLPALRGPTTGYRYKARLGVRWVAKKERILVGFREFGTGWVTDTESCPVLVGAVGERLAALAACIASLRAAQRIPQVEVAAGDDHVALILRHLDPLGDDDRHALRRFAAETGLLLYLQSAGLDSVAPLEPGQPDVLHYELPAESLRMAFRPTQFTQVNPDINRAMIARVLDEIGPEPGDHVLDLFCGIGNFSLPLARHAGRVTGVEGDAALVAQARENARLNGVDNACFLARNLYADLADDTWLAQRYDRVLLDPPRTGAEAIVRRMRELGPQKVVYVSCNPVTLVRDSVILAEQGYRLEATGVMDMFPHTAHVESMAVFERP